MRENEIACPHPGGTHRMAYIEWGREDNPKVLLCVHGLTRCSRDFDDLAQALSETYRVVCPDVVGRGRSNWLSDPLGYTLPQYGADMLALIAHLAPQQLDWVGTSMGGLIGMGIAAQKLAPIRRLVLNDVGPVITAVSLQRISQYLGKPQRFASLEAACAFVQATSPGFGALTPEQWHQMTEPLLRQTEAGDYVFRYDPRIAEAFAQALVESQGRDIELWPLYDAIACPTLLLRGGESDLLTRETAQSMTLRGPKASLVEFPGVGHAPALLDAAQIKVVSDFLLNT